ncbi:MAG: hypothetical protein PHP30_04875 [Bacteroidales bacterium]|nr:hypothetical protein [Bacteroidales bacterium]MDD2425524.1 hypothetical protein [Bacteroidales bacterium]MDD3989414.1 hypothetical protein [Bacteroidales bacterium]MDD4638360.1 hypothetical protein [Bacteroidales bacterium]
MKKIFKHITVKILINIKWLLIVLFLLPGLHLNAQLLSIKDTTECKIVLSEFCKGNKLSVDTMEQLKGIYFFYFKEQYRIAMSMPEGAHISPSSPEAIEWQKNNANCMNKITELLGKRLTTKLEDFIYDYNLKKREARIKEQKNRKKR